MPEKTYLGDAVYAEFDGFNIWLTTGDGNRQRIALNNTTYSRLRKWIQTASPEFASYFGEKPNGE